MLVGNGQYRAWLAIRPIRNNQKRASQMRFTASGVAGFMMLAGASAVLAQTVDGLDLGEVRARAREETADAQVFVESVVGRGRAHEAEAQELREQAMQSVASFDPAQLPKGPEGAVDFDQILAGAAANGQAEFASGPLFVVFASLSMPEGSLKSLIADTSRAGGVVVFRGFPQNNVKAFAEGLKKVVTREDQEQHLAIDPRLFRAFRVQAVPTFVIASRDYELCEGFDCSSVVPEHDKMVGNVTVEYALESFAGGRGAGAGVASVALANLKKGR